MNMNSKESYEEKQPLDGATTEQKNRKSDRVTRSAAKMQGKRKKKNDFFQAKAELSTITSHPKRRRRSSEIGRLTRNAARVKAKRQQDPEYRENERFRNSIARQFARADQSIHSASNNTNTIRKSLYDQENYSRNTINTYQKTREDHKVRSDNGKQSRISIISFRKPPADELEQSLKTIKLRKGISQKIPENNYQVEREQSQSRACIALQLKRKRKSNLGRLTKNAARIKAKRLNDPEYCRTEQLRNRRR